MQEEVNYNYLDLLNPQQKDAVVYKDGPSLVIAGAGSGKTRVLTYKIVDLLRNGFEPYRILALTFTNKAAREMKERIVKMVGEKVASRLWMGTFHSIFLRILHTHADRLGYPSNFTIYDASDSKSLVKMIIKELGLDDKAYKPATIANIISNSKNALISPEQYIADSDNYHADKRANRPLTGRIYQLYCQRCKVAGAMDFDDILVNMNILLRDNPDICRHYREFFRYILVDEYQDTNFSQHLIISQLTNDQGMLCVVGDDAQSIYSFRGANIANILQMEKRFPTLKTFKLERNYRSTQNIINAAGSLIEKNTQQLKKQVYSNNEVGEKILVVKTYSDMEEAYMVASLISTSKLIKHDSYEDYAILYRTNAQSRLLEESLRKRNIPYRIYGGFSFYQRKEIKDAISYFRVAVNPDDDEALRRIINYPARGIGETTMKKLIEAATQHGLSIWKILQDPKQYGVAVNSGTINKLNSFRLMIQEFNDDIAAGSDAYDVGRLIYNRTGILASLAHDNTPESISKQENLTELLSGLKEFVDLQRESGEDNVSLFNFLSEVSLATDQDQGDDNNEPKVTLMTVHAAKGLEFKHVFIVGAEEELFPSAMSMESLAQIEEERRLLYVAITRAKSTCVISFSSSRFRNGQTIFTRPSRFLSDIDKKYLKFSNSQDVSIDSTNSLLSSVNAYSKNFGLEVGKSKSVEDFNSKYGRTARDIRSVTGRNSSSGSHKISFQSGESRPVDTVQNGAIKIGTRLRHNRFGVGTVRKLEIVSGSEVMTVDFGVVGLKKLLLRYAKFDVLD